MTSQTNQNVSQIAALFGEQIKAKKTKSRRKKKERRNSETLRLKRKHLRKLKYATSGNNYPFNVELQSRDLDLYYNYDVSSESITKRGETADDARSSVCDDDTHKRQIHDEDTNRRLSQQIIDHDCDYNDDIDDDGDMMERVKYLDTIGATRTRDYYLLQQIHHRATTATADDACSVNLFGAEESMESDDDCSSDALLFEGELETDGCSLEDVECMDKTTLSELLVEFEIFALSNADIHNYFHVIRYCYEIVDILPMDIRKAIHYDMHCNMKSLMKVNKMCRFISCRVINGVWNGLHEKEWMALQHNSVYSIYQYKSESMNYQDCIYNNSVCDKDGNILQMKGMEKKYFFRFPVKKWEDDKVIVFKFMVENLPDKYRFEPKLFKVGVECGSESLYITDRLSIRRNEGYVNSMFIGNFVENGSIMFVRLRMDSRRKNVYVNLSHDADGHSECSKFDDKALFSKSFKMRIKPKRRIKLFVEQYAGVGVYRTTRLEKL